MAHRRFQQRFIILGSEKRKDSVCECVMQDSRRWSESSLFALLIFSARGLLLRFPQYLLILSHTPFTCASQVVVAVIAFVVCVLVTDYCIW